MHSARGRRKTWRAARQATEQVRCESWVRETRGGDGERRRGRKERQQQQKQQRQQEQLRGSTTAITKEHFGPTESPFKSCLSLCVQKLTLRCTMTASLPVKRSPSCISTSASEASQEVCNGSLKVLVDVVSRNCQEVFTAVEANTVQPVTDSGFYSSSIKGVYSTKEKTVEKERSRRMRMRKEKSTKRQRRTSKSEKERMKGAHPRATSGPERKEWNKGKKSVRKRKKEKRMTRNSAKGKQREQEEREKWRQEKEMLDAGSARKAEEGDRRPGRGKEEDEKRERWKKKMDTRGEGGKKMIDEKGEALGERERQEKREREEYEERRLRGENEKEHVCREEREKVRRSRAQEGCAGEASQEENKNRCREENVVPNRHAVWWKKSWWLRFDDGPHLRTARGRRRKV